MKQFAFYISILFVSIFFASCSGNKTKKNETEKIEKIEKNGVVIEMVSIPAGTFTMGSPTSEIERNDNETQHQVTLSAFKMSKYEVTFEQYDAFCDATRREKPSDEGWGRGKRPVINVSWDDANDFAEWMDSRLPTEAEWEYACRAMVSTAPSSSRQSSTYAPFNTGNNLTTSQANYDGSYPYNNNSKGESRQKTMPVGSFSANAYGLFDMHGNVYEWCNDWNWDDDNSSDPQTNPKGPASGSYRVFRGGCWDYSAGDCRSAKRNYNSPDFCNPTFGFRLVTSK